jgi:tetratricopeptide (TPR) repeat protein
LVLGVALPHSYREFLLRWNGAYLFRVAQDEPPQYGWWEDSGLVIQGTHTLLEFTQANREGFTDEEWNSLIPFCYLGSILTGDFCALDPQQLTESEYAILDCDYELDPARWRQAQIASSFAEWLARTFNKVVDDKKQPEYWYETESSFSLAEETPYVLLRQGRKKVDKGDPQGAIADFNHVLLLTPKDSHAYYERGYVTFTLGDYQKAIEDYTQAICFTPQNVIFYNKRGLARIELKDYQGVIEDFNQALQRNHQFAEGYNNRGNARSQLGDRQRAMEDYQKAAKLLAQQQRNTAQSEQLISTTAIVNNGKTIVLKNFCNDQEIPVVLQEFLEE